MGDYVHGRLPEVCAVTGVATTDQVRLRTNVARISQAWYLALLLGPIGWTALVVALLGTRRILEGWLPYSHEVVRRRRSQRRMIVLGGVLGALGALVIHIVIPAQALVWAAGLSAVVSVAALGIMSLGEPRIGMDPSGRMVKLSRCHPGFVDAIEMAGSAV